MIDGIKLNIVNEAGEIIGEDSRENIHQQGLLHREIHVWFYTPQGELIFQHRAKDKDTFPDLLDATVGGHVEIGNDYEVTALKEVKEETGVDITKNDLHFIEFTRSRHVDQVTKKINNVLRAVYSYCYRGKLEDLKIEKGKSLNFELWSFDKLFNISNEDKIKFIPAILDKECLAILHKIKKLI